MADSGERLRVLLIEDDLAVREGLTSALSARGYAVHSSPNGNTLDRDVRAARPDLAILDVTLGDGPDGFDLAARIRGATTIPIIFLTAADDVSDRIKGFEVGADDYLVKPFSVEELLVRMRAVLRRTGTLASATLETRDVVVNTVERWAARAGAALSLTPIEFDILATLMATPGRVRSKRELLLEVWGFDEHRPHVVEVHVSSLRRKLEQHGPRVVHTQRGGYVVRL